MSTLSGRAAMAGQGQGGPPAGGRKLAEWVSLGGSSLLVAGIAGFLVYQAILGESEYVPATVTPQPNEVREVGGWYVLAVEVRNHGRRTLRGFTGEVRSGFDVATSTLPWTRIPPGRAPRSGTRRMGVPRTPSTP